MAAGKPVAQKIRELVLKRKPVALQIIGCATSEKKTWRTYKNWGSWAAEKWTSEPTNSRGPDC